MKYLLIRPSNVQVQGTTRKLPPRPAYDGSWYLNSVGSRRLPLACRTTHPADEALAARQLHLAQEGLEARVMGHVPEQRLADDLVEGCILLPVGALEPIEGVVVLIAIRVRHGHE